MSSLIHKLNALAHLTPDEIQSQISMRGWIRLSTMTPAQHKYLDKGPLVMAIRSYTGDFIYLRGPNDVILHVWSLEDCLDSYWEDNDAHFCLVEDFVDGTFPS